MIMWNISRHIDWNMRNRVSFNWYHWRRSISWCWMRFYSMNWWIIKN